MHTPVESTDRGPTDYFHFGAIFFGTILAAAGVALISPGVAIFGLILVVLGLAYFLVQN